VGVTTQVLGAEPFLYIFWFILLLKNALKWIKKCVDAPQDLHPGSFAPPPCYATVPSSSPMAIIGTHDQGCWQKNFQGGGRQRKKRLKNSNKTENSTIKPLPEGGRKKDRKNSTIKHLSTISVPVLLYLIENTFDRKPRIYAKPSSYPNPNPNLNFNFNSNPNINTNTNPNPNSNCNPYPKA